MGIAIANRKNRCDFGALSFLHKQCGFAHFLALFLASAETPLFVQINVLPVRALRLDRKYTSLNSTEVPKVGIPKQGIPKSGIPKIEIPKTGIPKVGKARTGTLPETEISKARDSLECRKWGCNKWGFKGLSGLPSWKSAEIGPFRPFSALFRPFPERPNSTWKIQKTEEKGLFPQISSDLLKPPSLKPPFAALQGFRNFEVGGLPKTGIPKAGLPKLGIPKMRRFRASLLQTPLRLPPLRLQRSYF